LIVVELLILFSLLPSSAAALPLSATKQLQMSQALVDATSPNGPQTFLKSLQTSGIVAATDIELRYVGNAPDGYLDITKRLEGDVFGAATPPTPPPPSSKMSTTELAAIIGGVCGGVVLVALIAALCVSYRRRGKKDEKELLTQRWKTERELAESQRMKLVAQASSLHSSSSRRSAAHEAGVVAMTRDDLDRQRSTRLSESRALASQLTTRAETPMPASPAKKSRLDNMRTALGLGKLTAAINRRGGNESQTQAPPTSGAASDRLLADTGLQPPRQYSSSRAQSFGGTPQSESKTSAWGRMFKK